MFTTNCSQWPFNAMKDENSCSAMRKLLFLFFLNLCLFSKTGLDANVYPVFLKSAANCAGIRRMEAALKISSRASFGRVSLYSKTLINKHLQLIRAKRLGNDQDIAFYVEYLQ